MAYIIRAENFVVRHWYNGPGSPVTLASHTRLGPYEILEPIGAGGMGEVYRARDTRLDRTVAIKVLLAHVADQPELRQRFEREARAVSSLNHPHICTLYDVGQQDGIDYLVMEHLEGEALGKRLAAGPLPVEQAMRYAVQTAEALAEAHRHGVFHRDLKPGNIMLTKSGAKLLDFGLAKVGVGGRGSGVGGTTLGADLTKEGTILGTLQYMAPEQLEGKEADARSDIFAFGAVLYEMFAGRKAFQGESHASVIMAIMASQPPPVSTLQPVAPALDHLVEKCLAKDPGERWQTAQDLASELKWIAGVSMTASRVAVAPAEAPPPAQRRASPRLWMAVAAGLLLATVALAAVAIVHFRETPPRRQTIRFEIHPPEKERFQEMAVSPDGERLAFTTGDSTGTARLWVRPLDSLAAQPLPGSEGAYLPFWSPDSRSIAFFAGGKLKKIDLLGGPAQTLCDAQAGRSGAWNREGVILFRPAIGPIYRVSAAGGEARAVTAFDRSRQENTHSWPQFLPDGRHFLYTATGSVPENSAVYVASLDSKDAKRLINTNLNTAYARDASGQGYLLFARGNTLMAQAFDAGRLELAGEPFPAAENMSIGANNAGPFLAAFSVSQNGVLAYARGGGLGMKELTWFDREGKRLSRVGEPADYSNPAFSPDEKRFAVGRVDPQANARDIWIFDLARGASSRFTFDRADDFNPTWSPDGARLAFTSIRKGHRNLYLKSAAGTTAEEPLLESDQEKAATDWSRDGRFLFFNSGEPNRTDDVWAIPLEGDRKPFPVVTGSFLEQQGQLSPDGRWIAYESTESGRDEIYVQSFHTGSSPAGGKWQVSTAGGIEPMWRRDGKELFYRAADNKLMAVEVKPVGTAFEAGIPQPLFEMRVDAATRRSTYLPAANGQRFLVVQLLEQATSAPLTVAVNWLAGARR